MLMMVSRVLEGVSLNVEQAADQGRKRKTYALA
jgi:hypothetical protein